MSCLDIHDPNTVHYCDSMSYDGNPFNVSTGFTYPYGPTYDPLPSEIYPESCTHPIFSQPIPCVTRSVSSTVTPPLKYREIRPRPGPISPPPETKNQKSRRVQRPTKRARRTVSGVTGPTNQLTGCNTMRSVWLIPQTFVALAK